MNNLFPTSAGMYFAQREQDLILIKIKGLYPTLKLDSGIDIGSCLRGERVKEADKGIMSSIELYPEKWNFKSFNFIKPNVFSKNKYSATGLVSIAPDVREQIKNEYYLFMQQGVSVTKVLRALTHEYKISMEATMQLINMLDKEDTDVDVVI